MSHTAPLRLFAACLLMSLPALAQTPATSPTTAPTTVPTTTPATTAAATSVDVRVRLARFDQPIGFAAPGQFTRQPATRVAGPDAIDFVSLALDGRPLFTGDDTAEATVPLAVPTANDPPGAHAVTPGDHRFTIARDVTGTPRLRAASRTLRATEDGGLEVWGFPVLIRGTGDADVRDVSLAIGGRTIYENPGPLRSLTLVLPAAAGYRLSVAGRESQPFDVGLQPLTPGDPRNVPITLDLTLPGGGQRVVVTNAAVLAPFPNAAEWDADQQLLARAAAYERARRGREPDAVPLLASYPMEPQPTDADRFADVGPLGLDGRLTEGASLVDGGRAGRALRFAFEKSRGVVDPHPRLDNLTDALTATAWVKFDAYPTGSKHPGGTTTFIVTKRAGWLAGKPWSLGVGDDGRLLAAGTDQAGEWSIESPPQAVKLGQWQHVALTYRAGGAATLYTDGVEVASKLAPRPLKPNDEPLVFGGEVGFEGPGGGRQVLNGLVDDVRLYPIALAPQQVLADRDGTLRTAAAAPTTAPSPLPEPFAFDRRVRSMNDYLGLEVPRSPVQNYTLSLPNGLSGGHFFASDHNADTANGGHPWSHVGAAEEYA
ncbi:MAG TPA: LamG domain-containing protein, partial [Tepidisphaeraceae bacterium]|nr:LamG domain-containing protein [Tepidisphaeraceae bacterium]